MNEENNQNDILIFYVNGKKIEEKNPDPEVTLLTYLRNKLRLCGTKLGCGEGGCGACTVMISKYDRKNNKVKHFAVNACLMPICMVHGLSVTTVEGIGSTRTKLHPVQERIAKSYGSQCGFCTPGIVMSMYSLLRTLPNPSMKDLEIAFQGNLCRCTGYRTIIEGYRTFTKEFDCRMGDKCCKNLKNKEPENEETFKRNDFMPYDPSQEPIFPPALKLSDELERNSLKFYTSRVTWHRPINLNEILKIKSKHPEAKIITGNTEVGVETKFKYFYYPHFIASTLVTELNEITFEKNGITVGASVSLNELENVLRDQIEKLPEFKTRIYKAIVEMLQYFAGRQIRNVASLGGNIMTGSPISDLNPILMAISAKLNVANVHGSRSVNFDENFFTGYRKNLLKPDEILISIYIPHTNSDQFVVAYKQAKRREDDIAIVNCAVKVTFENESDIVKDIRFTYGGIAPTTVFAKIACENLKGKNWNENIIEFTNTNLIKEFQLQPDAPGGMVLYRKSLMLSLFFKSYLEITQKRGFNVAEKEKSGSTVFHTLEPKSTQFYEIVKNNDFKNDPVGRPKIHLSAYKQAAGEALYADDIAHSDGELYLALVLSTKAYAKIIKIDPTEALKQSGVHKFFSATDLDEKRRFFGPVIKNDEVFALDVCTHYGQILGAIVADNQMIAQRAARLVKIEYEEKSPIIISIEDAIKHNSYFPDFPKIMKSGDIENAFKLSDTVIEGEVRMGGQEHFYLETHVTLATPRDPDELEIICSTQHPSEIQIEIAHMLGIPASRVVVKTKRLGGGFGGKESRASILALPVALAAYKMRRPIRCMLDRDEDMITSGGRHPFLFKYKVGVKNDGKILGCHIKIYNNGGNSSDLSYSVLDRAMHHFQNAYYIPNVLIEGYVCKTHTVSNTAFRGFGGPQGMFAGENIIRDIAKALKKDYKDIIELNMYKIGDLTHYNQMIDENSLRRCWDEVVQKSNYDERKKEIDVFNSKNRWKKRGISLVPTQFGIAFTVLFLNQGGALVHVYEDGSVLISHGGTEMGQGLHTKMIQVAAKCLNIPIEKIHISETSTDKVPNVPATAASASSDLNGMAIINACEKILKRLEPIKTKYPDKDWDFWALQAFLNRISLSASGFYATPGLGSDGRLFNYYTHGAACTEVEIDCLTGDHQVIRTDIVMDLGSSLNPTIDIGQIEGAFVQGYGLFTLEELIVSSKGMLFSRGPGMYKIPGFFDAPAEFNVSLLTDCKNPRAVYSSKAVGEPPLFLAASAFFAIKEAIVAARKEENYNENFRFDSPATSARIRMACTDRFTKLFDEPKSGTFTPWNITP